MSTLYRQYRPRTFAEVEGQDHITRTLQGALISGNIGHAYLFCGPRGTGKTTSARLFAKALNCEKLQNTKQENTAYTEPCNECNSCKEINENRAMDLIEIDAASNRGIDEIRELKDNARVASSTQQYKIFIIDEVHMLTTPAFNALLKVLEEPPAHVLFIMATTEPHKILDTILSRVQRFDFKKIPQQEITRKLARIAQQEQLTVEESVYPMLVSVAGGSLRDAESAFAKLIAHTGNTITASQASDILGIVPSTVFQQITQQIQSKQPRDAITTINHLYESGTNIEHFTDQFIRYLRESLITQLERPEPATIDLTVRLIRNLTQARNEQRFSPIPQLPLELALIETSTPHGNRA